MNRWLVILCGLAAVFGRAEGRPADSLTAAGINEFTIAYRQWDGARFAAAADLFRAATAEQPNSSTNYYWLGVAEFHRMLQLRSLPASRTNEVAATAAMDAALAALNTAVKRNDADAESHALLGTLYGMKIDGNLVRAIRFGPRVSKHRDQALQFGSDDPRVRYLLGMCQFHTATKPSAQREALATLLAAEALFAAEARQPATPLAPRWGRASCLTFIGRTYELLGQPAKAADYFQRALAEQPSNRLAKDGWARVTASN